MNRFRWNFGDGAIGGGPTPEHIFTEPGEYRVLLTVTGDQIAHCDNSDTDEVILKVLKAPAPRISAPGAGAVDDPIAFSAADSSGEGAGITSYGWDFGDGSEIQEGREVMHAYMQPGRYRLTLTLKTDGNSECSEVRAQQLVTVNGTPMAAAGGGKLVGVDQLVAFNGSESTDDNAITRYQWDFGDGESAEGVAVDHRYRNPGRYRASLTVTDNTDLKNNTDRDTIEVVVNAPPSPQIDVIRPACPGIEARFSGASSSDPDGAVSGFRWVFGDGAAATGPEVGHVYSQSGIFPLSLVVDDGSGVNNSLAELAILLPVNNAPVPIAGPNLLACPGENVAFDASASLDPDGQLVSYLWHFGNEIQTAGQQVEHSFDSPGTYTVTLEVTDNSGSTCGVQQDTTLVRVNSPPIARAGPDRKAFVGGVHDALLFDATASADADQEALIFSRDFGDGSTSTGVKVFHAFEKLGSYTVRLTATDPSGLACDSASDEIIVTAVEREN